MKAKEFLLIFTTVFCVASCTSTTPTTDDPGDGTNINPGGGDDTGGQTPPPSGPTKVSVPAHTLKDSNPPFNCDAKGEKVTETTWNSFKNAADSKFNNYYNYYYWSYSGGNQTIEAFTKNGYFTQSMFVQTYYERKSGSTFYKYAIDTKYNYQRSETTLNLQSKFIYRIKQEIYVHMGNFSDYEWDDDFGYYACRALGQNYSSIVKFQNGYLSYMYYVVDRTNIFEIKDMFNTTIEIPESYYYKS